MAHLGYAGARGTAESSTGDRLIAVPASRWRRPERLLPLVMVVAGLLAWEWAAWSGRLSELFFPAPMTIATTLIRLFVSGPLLLDTSLTLYRMGVGLLIGASVGTVLGMIMGWSMRVRRMAEPFVAALHPLPKSALLPLFLVLMGIGDKPRLALVALAAFFPLLINTMSSVRNIDPALLEAAANYGARGFHLFRRIIFPASLPGILSGLRIAANTAMTIAITTELVMPNNGLGARIWLAWETLRTENLYATLIVIAVVGLTLNWLLALLARRLMPWSPLAGAVEK